MIVVQWSMTEWFLEAETRRLIGDDKQTLEEYEEIRNFQQALAFWRKQVELKQVDPLRSTYLALVPRIQELSSQRDHVVHRLWAGGMESQSWSAGGLETTDAALMPDPSEPVKAEAAASRIPPKWKITFIRLRRLAEEMATLNRDLLMTT